MTAIKPGEDQHDMDDEEGECCAEARCFSRDFCGVFCTSFAWFTLTFCSGTVILCLQDIPYYILGIYLFFVGSAMTSLFLATWSDPGYVEKGTGREKWAEISADVRSGMRQRLEERRQEVFEENKKGRFGDKQINLPDGTIKHVKVALAPRIALTDAEIEVKCNRAVEKFRRKVRYCHVCDLFKPASAHHCRTCGRCINRLDHHCPWISGCVGELNQRYFLLFLFYVFLSASSSILLFLYRSYMSVYYSPPRRRGEPGSGPWPILFCIFSAILCCFFCAFVCAMSCEQYEAVTTGIPGIDAMQGVGEDQELSIYRGLKKYPCLGNGLSPLWFLPIPLRNKNAKKEKSSATAASKKND